MANPLEGIDTNLSKKLFGKEIPVDQMTVEQLKAFKKALPEALGEATGHLPGGLAKRTYDQLFSRFTEALDKAEQSAVAGAGKQGAVAKVQGESEVTRQRREAALGRLGTAQETASGAFRGVTDKLGAARDTANKFSTENLQELKDNFSKLNTQDQNALADYLSATDPLMKEIFATAEDPADLQRQLDAYDIQKGAVDKYKSLTDPEVTGKERYMSELARREFEAADRSNRQAVSEQMANRGLRSGGQEIAANQSMQQQLSQDRLLKELGIQAGAVDRSMKALEGYASSSNALGLAAGAIRTADASEREYQDTFKVKERERIAGLAGDRKTASDMTTGNVGGRQERAFTAGEDLNTKNYNRTGDVLDSEWKGAEKDYGMAGDYFNADTGVAGENLETLIGSEGLGVNADIDEEERGIAGLPSGRLRG